MCAFGKKEARMKEQDRKRTKKDLEKKKEEEEEREQSLLVAWCFEPSQPQSITSGLNTNFYLQFIHFISHYTTSHVFLFFVAYLFSAGTQHGNLHPAG